MNQLYCCILLVDDDAITNFLHKHILENLQICQQIMVCHNGKEAWQYLQEHYITADHQWQIKEPILILLDINMPLMNGFEFLEKLKNLPAHQQVKIVMLTTSLNPADLIRAQNYGIQGYLEKPLTVEKLRALIHKR